MFLQQDLNSVIILAVKLKMSNQDRMIFGDFSVNFEPISLEILHRPFSIPKIMRSWLIIFSLTGSIGLKHISAKSVVDPGIDRRGRVTPRTILKYKALNGAF